MKKELNLILEKIKNFGIVNTIIISVFIFGIIYFLIYSVGYIGRQFFDNEDVEIYYDYNNESLYSLNSENENYKISLVTSYNTFYNIEDIIMSIINNMSSNNYDQIVRILSSNMKQNYNISDNEFTIKIKGFFDNFVNDDINNIYLYEVYNIDNTNIYICNLKNAENQEKRIVLNIDFSSMKYTIENIDF